MIRVTGRGLETDAQATHYSVAGQPLACQESMSGLHRYTTGLATRSFTDLLSNFVEPPLMTAANAKLRYFGKAYFDGGFREVRFWRSGDRGQLDVDGTPVCQLDFNEAHIHVLNDAPLGIGLNLEVIIGPALVLLLTQHHTYCMHAAAVDTPIGRIGIIGESGAGKSTLSSHLDENWSQVCDDIMPVISNDAENNVGVLSDFPQLKLNDHVVVDFPKQPASLDYLLRLIPKPGDSIEYSVLARTQAMLQVVRHTVAAKLFDTSMLEQHAAFAKDVSLSVPVVEVVFPRELNQLDNFRESIVDYLGSL